MPTFYPQKWGEYTVQAKNSRILRDIMRFYSFGASTEILPYFYSTDIVWDLLVICHKRGTATSLNYEWVLSQIDDKPTNNTGRGNISISNLTVRNNQKNAIQIGRVSKTGQYKVKIRLSDGVMASPFMDIAEFTIKDKDEFGGKLFLVLVSAIVGAIVGGLIAAIAGG